MSKKDEKEKEIDEKEIEDEVDENDNAPDATDQIDDLQEEKPEVVTKKRRKKPFAFKIPTKSEYSKPILAKLKASDDNVKALYSQIRNELSKLYELKFKSLVGADVYYLGDDRIVIIRVYDRSLKVYFDLKPKNYDAKKYHFQDVSDIKKYETAPLMLKVKSSRSFKYILYFIGEIEKEYKLKSKDVKYVPYMEDFDSSSKELMEFYGKGSIVKNSCVFEKADVLSDAILAKVILLKNTPKIPVASRIIGEISVGELSAAFDKKYIITLNLLKEVGLLGTDINYLRINSLGTCYHAITVAADYFEDQAAKMIILSGGSVIKLVG
ncbi:MAG: hypothetical protein WCS56_02670 [Bacilli bacterium]